ncbi:MAG: hypothetical protein P1V81_03705 [Planctomycetota bacterium]|nr:hypothetical protein [Planctomycetota bacterium]
MEIRNLTTRPLRIPLPGGKSLHLGPRKVAKIVPKSLEHPPVKELLEAETIEVVVGGRTKGANTTNPSGPSGSQSGPSAGGVRHTGDR